MLLFVEKKLNIFKGFFYARNLKANSMFAGFKFMLIGKLKKESVSSTLWKAIFSRKPVYNNFYRYGMMPVYMPYQYIVPQCKEN